MSKTRQLLDPIGTLCKLVSLNFCDSDTKISIHNHVIGFHDPSKVQWILRSLSGDCKENISELYYVITKLILWFLIDDEEDEINIPNNNNAIRQSEEIKRMVTYLREALVRLQVLTYQYGNVTLALQYYIMIINAALKNEFSIDMLVSHLKEQENFSDNLLDQEKLKNLWELRDVKRICELYDNCFALSRDSEEDNENKHSLIQSYLKSIESILKITDEKFQKLIRNNSNG